jgi:hypothetical protein
MQMIGGHRPPSLLLQPTAVNQQLVEGGAILVPPPGAMMLIPPPPLVNQDVGMVEPMLAAGVPGVGEVDAGIGGLNSAQLRNLLPVYRVGMLAMETLAKRVHDDRPQTKYSRNPPYGEDVKWLLGIAMKLGEF